PALAMNTREALQHSILQAYEKAGKILQTHKKEAIGLGILISLPMMIKSLKSTLKQRRQRAAKARSLQELSYMLQEINALYLAEQAKHQGQNAITEESMAQEPSRASAQ